LADKRHFGEGLNKTIKEDEATYEDHNTVLLINLIVRLIVDTTLAQATVTHPPEPSQQITQQQFPHEQKSR